MSVEIQIGDCRSMLATLPDKSVHCCVTSPPYFGLRDYGVDGQIGLEQTPDEYVAEMVAVFREVRRALRDDGTLWLNLGDSYAGGGYSNNKINGEEWLANMNGDKRRSRQQDQRKALAPLGIKPKDLIGIPWRVAFALQADGWYLRQDIIWHKPNPMPESVKDRCTKAHEYVFMLSKSARYYFDHEIIKEDGVKGAAGSEFHTGKTGAHQLGRASTKPRAAGVQHKQNAVGNNQGGYLGSNDPFEKRNRRSVWTVSTKPFKGAHFATFPPDLIEPCVLAGCPVDGTVLDPFGGAGTTGLVAKQHGRNAVLLELNPEYAAMARERIDAPFKAKKAKKPANDNRTLDLFGVAV